MHFGLRRLGIRTKLIALFLAIKVAPLILLAALAWEGVNELGTVASGLANSWSSEVRSLAAELGKSFATDSERALNDRAREELERLTTDTARSVSDFLYDRDQDVLLAAQMEPDEGAYRRFVANRTRGIVATGRWQLAADGSGWVQTDQPQQSPNGMLPTNQENSQDFHYRPPETVLRTVQRPLYREITFVGLDGHEIVKISTGSTLAPGLRDVSKRENTYCKAEGYFTELSKLKPGQVWVSDVIGPYVGSRLVGPATPEKARSLGVPFDPDREAYAGKENPVGKRFEGIVRWATPVVRGGKVVGYVTLALDHAHLMGFTENLLPGAKRYTTIADASDGNYAFMWDYRDRAIAHPRHASIVGMDPATGQYATPWLPADLYDAWKKSGKPIEEFLAGVPKFDQQSRDKKPAGALTKAGMTGLDCRYLNFAPQCQGWHDLTKTGGSGSFLILWSGVWKLTTAASIPYYTGQYGTSPRGFGYVTIGANIDDFRRPALLTTTKLNGRVQDFENFMQREQHSLHDKVVAAMSGIAGKLTVATLIMIFAVIAVAIWLASVLSRRITYLTTGLRRIEEGDFGHRLVKTSQDELGLLTESLNRMADSVQQSFRQLEDDQLDALRRSEAQHRQVVDNAFEGILVIQNSRIVFANPKLEELSGYQEAVLCEMTFVDLVHPEDRELVAAAQQRQLLSAEEHVRYSFRLLRGDGATRWVELSSVLIEWLEQAATLSFITDVSENRRLEEHLKEVLAEREAILDHAVVGIAFLNPEGRAVWANRAMGQIFGVDLNGILGESLGRFYQSRDEYLEMGKQVMEAVRCGQIFSTEFKMQRADGTLFWAHVSGRAVNPNNLEQGSVWVVSDISEQRELKEKLVRTTAEWEIILQSALIGIVYSNDRVIRFVNNTFADMLGYQPGELIGQNTRIYYSSDESWQATGNLVYPVLQGGNAYAGERQLQRRNGEIFWAQIYGKCITPGQPSEGVIWTIVDISERRKAEQDILKAVEQQRELNDLKSRFVSMTSHEFRTPLATILSSAELLRYYGEKLPKEDKDEVLGSIDTAVTRMTRMLDGILVIGKADAGQLDYKPAPVRLDDFCSNLIQQVANAILMGGRGSANFDYVCSAPEAVVELDEKLLEHVLDNLLSNAFKYSPNGKLVRFKVDCDASEIRFRIIDQGIGIPEEALPKLFETFHRAANVGNIPGTGLGMAIVKRALDLHGGRIEVKSEVGCGTTFTVSVPRQRTIGSAE